MTTLTVTARGQVTFCNDVLQHLGVRPFDFSDGASPWRARWFASIFNATTNQPTIRATKVRLSTPASNTNQAIMELKTRT